MSQIQAVTIIIEKDGRYLLGKRSPWKTTAPGYWCPVSGKIEAGESEEEAVCREAFEEVGLKVEALQKLCEMDTRDGSGRLHWWTVRIVKGKRFSKMTNIQRLVGLPWKRWPCCIRYSMRILIYLSTWPVKELRTDWRLFP